MTAIEPTDAPTTNSVGRAAAPSPSWPVRAVLPVGLLGLGALALALPWLVNAYVISLASTALIAAMVAMSTQLLNGVAGLPSIGQAAYLLIGAVAAAQLGRHGITNGPVQLAGAVLAALTVAAAVGVVAVRTRATGYLMLTLAVAELVHIAAVQAAPVTGGSNGLDVPPVVALPGAAPLRLDGPAYLYVLVVVALTAVGIGGLLRTRYVLILRTVAGAEARARATGHRSNVYLWTAHTIAGGIAGVAGALTVAAHHYTAPADGSFDASAIALIAAAIGMRSMTGAAVAAVGLVGVRDLAGGALAGSGPILLGLACLVVAYVPREHLTRLIRRQPQLRDGGRRR